MLTSDLLPHIPDPRSRKIERCAQCCCHMPARDQVAKVARGQTPKAVSVLGV